MASHGTSRVSDSKPRSDQAKQEDLKKIKEYRTLETQVISKVQAHDYTLETLALTSKLLTKNPEYYTIWNHRRRILQSLFLPEQPQLDPPDLPADPKFSQSPDYQIPRLLTTDLAFLLPLLRSFPKCYWLWSHRLWLLSQASTLLPVSQALEIWTSELSLVSRMLTLDARNYHGWSYRRIVIQNLENLAKKSLQSDDSLNGSSLSANPINANKPNPITQPSTSTPSSDMTLTELNYTTTMLHASLSNFSAWHWRSIFLSHLSHLPSSPPAQQITTLDSELTLIQQALYTDVTPYDASIWSYYLLLITNFSPSLTPISTSATSNLHSPRQPPKLIFPSLNPVKKLSYTKQEISNLLDLLDGSEDCHYLYQALIQLCVMHKTLQREIRPAKNSGSIDDETWPEEAGARQENLLGWMDSLELLDPLRRGRWREWRDRLGLLQR